MTNKCEVVEFGEESEVLGCEIMAKRSHRGALYMVSLYSLSFLLASSSICHAHDNGIIAELSVTGKVVFGGVL